MDEKQAILASITHWQEVLEIWQSDKSEAKDLMTADNCALCVKYNELCFCCPIYHATDTHNCEATPFYSIRDHGKSPQLMIDFLKTLLEG